MSRSNLIKVVQYVEEQHSYSGEVQKYILVYQKQN